MAFGPTPRSRGCVSSSRRSVVRGNGASAFGSRQVASARGDAATRPGQALREVDAEDVAVLAALVDRRDAREELRERRPLAPARGGDGVARVEEREGLREREAHGGCQADRRRARRRPDAALGRLGLGLGRRRLPGGPKVKAWALGAPGSRAAGRLSRERLRETATSTARQARVTSRRSLLRLLERGDELLEQHRVVALDPPGQEVRRAELVLAAPDVEEELGRRP